MIHTIPLAPTAEMPGEALLGAALDLARRINGHMRAQFSFQSPDTALAHIPAVILAAGVAREAMECKTQSPLLGGKGDPAAWRIATSCGGGGCGRGMPLRDAGPRICRFQVATLSVTGS